MITLSNVNKIKVFLHSQELIELTDIVDNYYFEKMTESIVFEELDIYRYASLWSVSQRLHRKVQAFNKGRANKEIKFLLTMSEALALRHMLKFTRQYSIGILDVFTKLDRQIPVQIKS